MSELEILNPEGELQEESEVILAAYMIYPSDEKARLEYTTIALGDGILSLWKACPAEETENFPQIDTDLILALLKTQPAEFVLKEAKKRLKRGKTAGQLAFMWLHAWSRYPELRPTQENAFKMLEEAFKASPVSKRKEKSSIGTSTIKERWYEFMTVAHLHAASWRLESEVSNIDTGLNIDPRALETGSLSQSEKGNSLGIPAEKSSTSTSPGRPETKDPEDLIFLLNGFLSLAESIRLKMEEFRIVKPGKLFQAPSQMNLTRLKLSFDDLPSWLLKHLQ